MTQPNAARGAVLGATAAIMAFSILGASPAHAAGGVIERWGETQLQGNQVVAAKEQAINKAITECIKVLVGFTSQSKMTDYMKAVAADEQQSFDQKIESKILTKARGFVKTYEVLKEERKGDIFRALVRAEVYEDKLQAEVQNIIKLIAAAGNPKLMVLIQEVTYYENRPGRIEPDGLLGAHIESVLQAWGFTLREKSVGSNLSVKRFDAWLDNPKKMAAMARKRGADLVVAGRLELREALDDGGVGLKNLLSGKLMGNLRLIDAATGTILQTIDINTSGPGVNHKRVVMFLIRKRLPEFTDELLAAMRREFRKVAAKGRELEVALIGVTNFRRQGEAFKGVVEGFSGVTSLKQKSYGDGRLVLDVVCTCSESELQSHIFSATKDNAAFSTLDLASSSGRRLELKL